MLDVRTITISIDRDWRAVYEFAAQPANMPRWASGLGALAREDGAWVAQTPQGPAKLRFSPRNELGILDHWVSPAPGVEIYIPLRVVANGTGSTVAFTLFRQSAMSDETFAADADWVARDLQALKDLLEA